MYAVSDTYLASISTGGTAVYATATYQDLTTGVTTVLDIEDGSVSEDNTAGNRGTLSLTIPGTQANYDLIANPGEITVTETRGVSYASTEDVPLGVFIVDTDQISFGAQGTLALTCPSRWLKVQRNRFDLSGSFSSIPTNTVWQEIKRLVEGAWSHSGGFPGWSTLDTSATAQVGSVIWGDGNRENAILDLAKAAGLDVFFDRAGKAVLIPIPVLSASSPAVYEVQAGANGTMISADKSRARNRIRNAVIVGSADATLVFQAQVAAYLHPGDPLSTDGPLGFVPYYYNSPHIKDPVTALARAKQLLPGQLGPDSVLSLSVVACDALDPYDVIGVTLPVTETGAARPYELHIIDSVSTPLLPGGTQDIQTRSTRPDDSAYGS